MPGPGLIVKDTITVKSQGGDCQIQLCFGDITKLKKKDKVDVIFVSAFENNYGRKHGTVIGALWENLNLNVKDLAIDKEEDLRSLYSCWWSKPLPSKLPYGRLLCFESRKYRAGRPQELVGHAFRCLVPMLNNKDASVITPVLSTGNQGFDTAVMLDCMVQAAVSWVKAGLPIRLLKIVIYATLEDGKATFLRGANDNTLVKFAELKSRYESANLIPEEITLEYDVYLSYSEKDQEIADRIQAQLLEEKPDISIYTSKQKLDNEVLWQEQMYEVMKKSARVLTGHEWQRTLYHSIDGSACMIALISTSYLKSAVCMEEYSLAQTKHLSQDKLHLIPVCIADGLESDFSTISHIAMCDARPSVYEGAVASICAAVVFWLEMGSFNHMSRQLQKVADDRVDVPDLMERLRSARFQSEYGKDLRNTEFPPNLDKLTDAGPEEEGGVEGGDGGTKKGETTDKPEQEKTTDTSKEAVSAVEEQDVDGEVGVEKKNEVSREQEGQKEQETKAGSGEPENPSSTQTSNVVETKPEEEKSETVHVVFSYHETDAKFVYHLHDLILAYAPNVVLKSEFSSDQERLDNLEGADNIIALLSPNYMESPQHVEEFHIGLWRQRTSPAHIPVLLPIQVAVLPKRPTYFQLVGYPVNTWDALWADLQGTNNVTSPEKIENMRHKIAKRNLPKLSPDELLPMSEVAQTVISAIKAKRTLVATDEISVRPALVNTVKLQTELGTLTGQTPKVLKEFIVPVPPTPAPGKGNKSCVIT